MNKEKEYHRQRRMFFLIDKKLVLPKKGSDKSHIEWLIFQGKNKDEAQSIIDNNLRGALNPDGEIRFYTGENRIINKKIEKEFFEILPELIKRLKLNPKTIIGGGVKKGKIGESWPAIKIYGEIANYLK